MAINMLDYKSRNIQRILKMISNKIIKINSDTLIKDISMHNDYYTIVCRGDIDTRSVIEKKHDVLSGLELHFRAYIIKCREYPVFTISWSRHEYRAFIHRSNPYIVLIKGDITGDILFSLDDVSEG